MGSADRVKGVVTAWSGQQSESEEQSERAEARHQKIDVTGAHVLLLAVMRDHQRPRRQRHELPRYQEGESVVGEYHQIHPGKIGSIKRQHPMWRLFMAAIAEREQARCRSAKI